MPDVGVLNLQIHDNSSTAAEGLGRLAAKLEAVKNATSGIKLVSVATGIKRINDELKNVQPSVIFKLKQLADVLEKISTISGNVGGIRISFGGSSQSVDQIASQMQAARDAAAQATAEFEQIGNRIQEDIEKASNFSGSLGKVNEIVQQTGWSAQTTAEQFYALFNAWNAFRMSNSLNAGSNPLAIGDGSGGSGANWSYWKDGAIEVEGTVTDAMDSIRLGAGEATLRLTGVVQSTAAMESGFEYVNSTVQEMNGNLGTTDEYAQHMRMRIDAARAAWGSASDEVKEYVASLIGIDKNILFPSDAATNVNIFGNAMQSASDSAATLQDSLRRDYGRQMVEDLVNASSKADLLKMKIDALKDSLARKIDNNEVDGYQIAQATERIQALQAEYDALIGKTTEVNSETKSLSASFIELMVGADGLKGAFSRMFPTVAGLVNRFKQLVKYRMLRSIIRQISAGFQEGTENYYYYSQAIGGTFATNMDNAATSLQTMKNSIGSAVSPLINSLIPYLQTVANWFIQIVNYANQFFSLLNGQNTWSKATEVSTKAFDDISSSASGASDSVKDLLADWDELNIIQNESSSSGTGSTTKTTQDYLNMYEEESEFAQGIKDTVEWINEHMESILGIVQAIGVAILAWKVSNAFGGLIGDLATLVLGGALIAIGLQVTYEGAYAAGYNGGFDATTFIATAGGILVTTIGAAIIGYKFGGTWGAVVGGATGFIVSVATAIYAYDAGERQRIEESQWGSIHYTAEQLKEYAQGQFTFNIDSEIEVMNAFVTNSIEARNKVTYAVNEFKDSLRKVEAFDIDTKIDVNTEEGQKKIQALKDAAEDVQSTITAIQELIDKNEEGIQFTLTNFSFVDSEGKDISGELLESIKLADQTLKEYFTGVGTQIAKWIYEGEQSHWANGEYEMALELMQSQERILTKAEELKNQKLYEMTTDSNVSKAGNAFAVQDYDTAKGIVEEEQTRYKEYYNAAVASVEEEKQNLIYFASLASSAADEIEKQLENETDAGKRAEMQASIKGLRDSAASYTKLAEEYVQGFDDKVQAKLSSSVEKQKQSWLAMLTEVYGSDYISKLFGSTNDGGSWFEWLDDLAGVGHSTDDWIKSIIEEKGLDSVPQELYNYLCTKIKEVDTTGATQFYLDVLGGNLYDLIKNDTNLVQNIADGIVENTENRQMAYDIFKAMFGLDDETASKYIQTYAQNVWEDATKEIKEQIPDESKTGTWTAVFDNGTFKIELLDNESLDEAKDTVDNYFEENPAQLEVEPVIKEDATKDIKDLMLDESKLGTWTAVLDNGTFKIELLDNESLREVKDTVDNYFEENPIEMKAKPIVEEDVDIEDVMGTSANKSSWWSAALTNLSTLWDSAMTNINNTMFGPNSTGNAGFGNITVTPERNDEQDTANIAEGTKRGNVGMETKQNQTNTYLAQAITYLSIIANNSLSGMSISGTSSTVGSMVSKALSAFDLVKG